MSKMPDLTEYVEHFRTRVLQDALTEATRAYWRHRADMFEAARSRPGDFVGNATPEQIADRDARLAEIAMACRVRGAVSLIGGESA